MKNEGLTPSCHLPDTDEPINLGNSDEVTILDFAKEIIELTGNNSEICFKPLLKNDPQVRCPDPSGAKELLNWEPKIHRREGIKKILEYFRNPLEITRK